MDEQKNNVNLLLLHVATWLHDDDHNSNNHGVSSGKVHRGMWLVCPGQCGHPKRQQQCVGPTVIKTTPMIEDKTVAVEHLAEMSSGELADIVRDGRQREQEQAVDGVSTSSTSSSSTPDKKESAPSDNHQDAVADTLRKAITPPQHSISSPRLWSAIVPCGPAHWHRAGEALQPSLPASARWADTKAHKESHTLKDTTYLSISALKDAGARGGAGTRNTTTHRSEIRFWLVTFIVCAVFLRRVHHRGRVWPDSWDARMIDGMSQRITSSSCCWAWSPSFPGRPFLVSAVQAAYLYSLEVLIAAPASHEGSDWQHLQPAEGRYSQGNRVEERIDIELVQRGDKLKGAGQMVEAMITGRINPRLVSKGVIVVWAAPWYVVFEATHVGSEDAQLSKAPIQQRQAGGALCVKHRAAVGVWVALLTSGATDTLELTSDESGFQLAVLDKTGTLTVGSRTVTRLWRTSALSPATDFKTVSAWGISATVDSMPIVIGMPTVKRAVRLLHPHGLRLAMLTWATRRAWRGPLGAEVGIDNVLAAACRSWRQKGEVVMMVGDGINIESADVVLMIKDNLLDVFFWPHTCCMRPCSASTTTFIWVWCATPPTCADGGCCDAVHVSEIQSIATATTSSPSSVVLWHHFDEGDGFIGTISVSASREQHLLVPEAGSFGRVQPDLLLVAVPWRKVFGTWTSPAVWPLCCPPFGEHARLAALTQHNAGQYSFESATWTRDAKHVLLYGRALRCRLRNVCSASTRATPRPSQSALLAIKARCLEPSSLSPTSRSIDCGSVAELQRAVRMFPATVSTAVEDAETDTPLSLLFTSTSVSWLDCNMVQCVVDKVCEAIRAFFNLGG
ncbi:hypothetical protein PTSG_11940 [Salpingoeca rosetta]|uniref:Uncharacterized protein n=1 Tax=Salpingoeca rosetta (strain ATCC 50818 / BSB-021) TaxID=946362 RepID=F2U3M7_SALR5|nr:uncharacterized protein PTSG_11940 [Salpingoeca rosetta]EGD82221.1 hypothetical protein PTSG_11940 [Salpingoeca rosetta]|eukprot:XP_004996404.1 hypothetical protein PTSG_11940 [Salpingoeca rosetta]